MNFIGVDLHKKSITICVMDEARNVLYRRNLSCSQPERIRREIERRRPFQLVVEATASYEWFVKLVEPAADRIVLAHPKHMRVIAETKNKSDRLDAKVLAEFLAMDMVPESHRPTPRIRDYRSLVRHRHHVQGRITSIKTKIRRILDNYNADRPGLFTVAGFEYLESIELSGADRFIVEELKSLLSHFQTALKNADASLKQFGHDAPVAEREAREVLATIPMVGTVTVDVILSELGDPRRFTSQKKAVAYAGLAPGRRESAGKARQLGITKEGSPLLRWAMVEAAWRLVGKTRRWGAIYENIKHRAGAKKAIVAVARRLLCVMMSMLASGEGYRHAA